MKTHFINNKSNELILFFLGWGMDEHPMLPLKSKRDILYIYDYSNLDFYFDYSNYKKVYLISFSAGVSVSAYLQIKNITKSIAINGVIEVCNKNFGLTPEIVEVFKSITTKNYIDFRKSYLVASEEELEKFNTNTPLRTFKSSMEELEALQKYPFKNNGYKFDKVLISQNDKILPITQQRIAWKNDIEEIQGGHFPFYRYKDLDEIIEL